MDLNCAKRKRKRERVRDLGGVKARGTVHVAKRLSRYLCMVGLGHLVSLTNT